MNKGEGTIVFNGDTRGRIYFIGTSGEEDSREFFGKIDALEVVDSLISSKHINQETAGKLRTMLSKVPKTTPKIPSKLKRMMRQATETEGGIFFPDLSAIRLRIKTRDN